MLLLIGITVMEVKVLGREWTLMPIRSRVGLRMCHHLRPNLMLALLGASRVINEFVVKEVKLVISCLRFTISGDW